MVAPLSLFLASLAVGALAYRRHSRNAAYRAYAPYFRWLKRRGEFLDRKHMEVE